MSTSFPFYVLRNRDGSLEKCTVEKIEMVDIVDNIIAIVWNPALVVLLVTAGIFFTIRTRFVQLRQLPLMMRLLFGEGRKNDEQQSLSSFQAFFVALSGCVGTGNIVGVATAIALGGPGSVFWMWVIAFFGAATSFTESTLANKYRYKHLGCMRGGPSSYISEGLHLPVLGIVFSAMIILNYGMLLMLAQSNGITTAVENAFNVPSAISGIVLAMIFGFVIIGGMKRIANVACAVAPFMSVLYIIMAVIIIVAHIGNVPHMFCMIIGSAIGTDQIFGGIIGSAVAIGVRRGLFSNEAGEGGGAIASASANVDHPAKQGLVQAFSVYVDTLLVCTATAFMILSTNCYNVYDNGGNVIVENAPELGQNYVSFTQSAIDTVFPGFGSAFVSIVLFFFAFTTMLAYYFYAESSFSFICKSSKMMYNKYSERKLLTIYKFVALFLVFVGAVTSTDLVWKLTDIGVGITTWINVIVLLILFPEALALLKDFESKHCNSKKTE